MRGMKKDRSGICCNLHGGFMMKITREKSFSTDNHLETYYTTENNGPIKSISVSNKRIVGYGTSQPWLTASPKEELWVLEPPSSDKYSMLKEIVSFNEAQLNKVQGDQGSAVGLITFTDVDNSTSIYDPFYDSSLRFPVDPIKEYGIEAILLMYQAYAK